MYKRINWISLATWNSCYVIPFRTLSYRESLGSRFFAGDSFLAYFETPSLNYHRKALCIIITFTDLLSKHCPKPMRVHLDGHTSVILFCCKVERWDYFNGHLVSIFWRLWMRGKVPMVTAVKRSPCLLLFAKRKFYRELDKES